MKSDAERWQHTAELYGLGRYMDPALAQHTREVSLELVRRWAPQVRNPRVLKTDAFADATCPERAFSWFISEEGQLVCFDIAPGLARQAKANAGSLGYVESAYVAADVRCLPFENDSFDLIVSDSTLDHFHTTAEIDVALRELARVLKPGGVMIVTLDNPHNVTNPLMRLWMKSGRTPYFIGKTFGKTALTQSLERIGLTVTDTTAQFHYPRYITKATLRWMRRIAPRRCSAVAMKALTAINQLEHRRIRYLTGLFVAARAEKPAINVPDARNH